MSVNTKPLCARVRQCLAAPQNHDTELLLQRALLQTDTSSVFTPRLNSKGLSQEAGQMKLSVTNPS